MKTRKAFKIATLLLLMTALSSVGWAAPTVYADSDSGINAPSFPLFAKEGDGGSSGLSPDSAEATGDKMKEEKEHKHDEGMDGMMGHHSTGWAIAIGVVMVLMMVAMVL